jgi:hypothetical protein
VVIRVVFDRQFSCWKTNLGWPAPLAHWTAAALYYSVSHA